MDITMCDNDSCPLKHQCYRQMAVANEMYQSFASFEYDSGCPFFIARKDRVPYIKKEKK